MVELNLEELVRQIEAESGMPSTSTQTAEDAEAALMAFAASGRDYDSQTVGVPMPELATITEAQELVHSQPVYYKSRGNDHCTFFFDVERPCVVKVNVWPLDMDSGASLFVSIGAEPDQFSAQFRSNMLGSNQIIVHPDDPGFRHGRWFVLARASNYVDE